MKMLRMLVILFASCIIVSPEPIREERPVEIRIFPPVEMIDSDGNVEWTDMISLHRRSAEEDDPRNTEQEDSRSTEEEDSHSAEENDPRNTEEEDSRSTEEEDSHSAEEEEPRSATINQVLYLNTSIDPRAIEIQRQKAINCLIPTALNDSMLTCKFHLKRVICIHICVFGKSFEEGITRTMECTYKENVWHPTPTFELCKPFIDCTLEVGPGGSKKCHYNFLDKGPQCEVRCDAFQRTPSIEPSNYTCNEYGEWTPQLPFCARPRTGEGLFHPPPGPLTLADFLQKKNGWRHIFETITPETNDLTNEHKQLYYF